MSFIPVFILCGALLLKISTVVALCVARPGIIRDFGKIQFSDMSDYGNEPKEIFANFGSDRVGSKITYGVYSTGDDYITICWNERTVIYIYKNGDKNGFVDYAISMQIAPKEDSPISDNIADAEPYEINDAYNPNKRVLNFVTVQKNDSVTIKENRTVNCRLNQLYSKIFTQLASKKRFAVTLRSPLNEHNFQPLLSPRKVPEPYESDERIDTIHSFGDEGSSQTEIPVVAANSGEGLGERIHQRKIATSEEQSNSLPEDLEGVTEANNITLKTDIISESRSDSLLDKAESIIPENKFKMLETDNTASTEVEGIYNGRMTSSGEPNDLVDIRKNTYTEKEAESETEATTKTNAETDSDASLTFKKLDTALRLSPSEKATTTNSDEEISTLLQTIETVAPRKVISGDESNEVIYVTQSEDSSTFPPLNSEFDYSMSTKSAVSGENDAEDKSKPTTVLFQVSQVVEDGAPRLENNRIESTTVTNPEMQKLDDEREIILNDNGAFKSVKSGQDQIIDSYLKKLNEKIVSDLTTSDEDESDDTQFGNVRIQQTDSQESNSPQLGQSDDRTAVQNLEEVDFTGPDVKCDDEGKMKVRLHLGVVDGSGETEDLEKSVEVNLNEQDDGNKNENFEKALRSLVLNYYGDILNKNERKCPVTKKIATKIQPKPIMRSLGNIYRNYDNVYEDPRNIYNVNPYHLEEPYEAPYPYQSEFTQYPIHPSAETATYYLGEDGKYYIVPYSIQQEPSFLEKLARSLKSAVHNL